MVLAPYYAFCEKKYYENAAVYFQVNEQRFAKTTSLCDQRQFPSS